MTTAMQAPAAPYVELPPPRSRWGLMPVDIVLASYASLVAIVIAIRFSAIPRGGLWLAVHLGAAAGVLAAARATRDRGAWTAVWVRIAYLCTVVPTLFLSLGGIVPWAIPWRGERALKAIDDFLFLGRNPNELLDRIAFPALTEYLQVIYASYYFLPLFLVAALVRERRPGAIGRSATAIILSLTLSYLGYFAVPATSPSVNIHGLYRWPPYAEELASGKSSLPGLLLADRIRAFLYGAETIQHDCFPSGHTAMALVVLALARRHHRGAFRVILVPVLSLVFSTVYLRHHYAIDLQALEFLGAQAQRAEQRLAGGIQVPAEHIGGAQFRSLSGAFGADAYMRIPVAARKLMRYASSQSG